MDRDDALRWVRNVGSVVKAVEAVVALELTNASATADSLRFELHEALLEDLPELEAFIAALPADSETS
jgi:hypothetical protein